MNKTNKYLSKGTVMIKMNHKQAFALLVCSLLAPQVLCAYTQMTNDIELKVNDCAANLGEVLVYTSNPITAGQFLEKGIHPVRVKISNKSNHPIVVSPKSVFKEQVDVFQAARMFHLDNQFTASLLLDYYLLTIAINSVVGLGIGGLVSVFVPILPPGSLIAGVYCLYVRDKNKQLSENFNRILAEQRANGECVIQPGASMTKILLLKKEHRIPRFTFRVFDKQSNQAVASFEVKLED